MNAIFSPPVIHGKKCMTVVFFSKKKQMKQDTF